MTIPILYEEPHFMLVNKPAGLFTQAAPGVPSLELALSEQLKERDQHPGHPFVGLPHRLDRATSGVLLVARNQRALSRFGQQFQSRKITKHYLALVHGVVPDGQHTWSDYLRKIPNVAKAELVQEGDESARLAEMRVESLIRLGDMTLAMVELLTGRMHQIRIQFASRGLPVVGDRLYGAESQCAVVGDRAVTDRTDIDSESLPEPSSLERESPHALHAYRLAYFHPQTAKAMHGIAPLPDYWRDWIELDNELLVATIAQWSSTVNQA